MHDIVIRGGTIVDGTGATAFSGDIAIDDGRIAAIGGKAGPARRVIDADGLLVTPGWVDVHTHYDGQATWDPILAPSSWHGVTTILFGNCGVGFAPVRRHHRDALIDLMEGVEDIPGPVLAEGLKWDWESFPDFLDALDRMPRAIDVAAQVPHHPLRVYAMGDRAIRREPATADDIMLMRRLTEEAVRAGAFGFTTSRTNAHKTVQGEMVPGRFAEIEELAGIGAGLGAAGAGTFGMNSDFEDEAAEFEWITRLGRETGRPVWFLLTDRPTDPQRWRRIMQGVHRARAAGASVTAQIAGRPVGVILGIATSLNPFSIRERYKPFEAMPLAERLKRLRDPAVRQAIVEDRPSPALMARLGPLVQLVAEKWDRMYVMGNPPDYEPRAEASIAAIAARTNHSPDEVAYDYLTENAANLLFFPVTGYAQDDHEPIREMLTDPGTLLGLGDGGAHVAMIVDPACLPTC
jgi:N-acyl-D-aspartate/D-glutamate deacylase